LRRATVWHVGQAHPLDARREWLSDRALEVHCVDDRAGLLACISVEAADETECRERWVSERRPNRPVNHRRRRDHELRTATGLQWAAGHGVLCADGLTVHNVRVNAPLAAGDFADARRNAGPGTHVEILQQAAVCRHRLSTPLVSTRPQVAASGSYSYVTYTSHHRTTCGSANTP